MTLSSNMQWRIKPYDTLFKIVPGKRITIIDVGCRGGLTEELVPLRKLIQMIGFDADPLACCRLGAEHSTLASRTIFPLFVGGSNGRTQFHLYRDAAHSSQFEPEPRFQNLFGALEVAETISVEGTTLDTFLTRNPDIIPDFLKLDSHGTELAILQSGKLCLRNCSLVEIEVAFVQIYKDQPLFFEIAEFMHQQGFELLHLNREIGQRKCYPGIARGQLIFGEALFGRKEDKLANLTSAQIESYIILLINFGHLDLAYEIVQENLRSLSRGTAFKNYLEKKAENPPETRIRRVFRATIEAVLSRILMLRKNNGLRYDSDKRYPVR